MSENYAGQNLNGRSFRGQDLRGTNFSDCTLKSCDFRDKDLTDAKFCRAQMGVHSKWITQKLLLGMLMGVLLGSVSVLGNSISVFFSQQAVKLLPDNYEAGKHFVVLVALMHAVSTSGFIYLSLKNRGWLILGRYYLGIIAVAGAVAGAAAIVGAEAAMGADVEAGTAITAIFLLLGWFLNLRAIKLEEPMLAWIRRYNLAWRCWGGTQFSRATLEQTDFTEADLSHANFTQAKFHHPHFNRARNLHLALTSGTVLQNRSVRRLLTEQQVTDRDFSFQHLRGLSFQGLDLSHAHFHHADLSEADFSGCDLTEADFSEAMVLGARFNGAKLTGAIIENWSMDKQTQFEGVICDFVYTQRSREERNPLQGTFKPGEFSKLYQEIANTVDFIAHSPDELQALLRAIDSIKQQGGDIVIQSLERKNESVVVRTQSHDSIDKAAIYAEVKAQVAVEWNALQQEKQLLLQKVDLQAQHLDTFTQLLSKAIESPKIMTDNSRHYENISAQNSALNFGDDSIVSNHIEQVADTELKAVLQGLQQLLDKSNLPTLDKQEAQKAIDDLASVSHKPESERKSLARRSLAFLRDLHQDLSSVVELGKQYGELVAKLALWF